jgi:endoglucanase
MTFSLRWSAVLVPLGIAAAACGGTSGSNGFDSGAGGSGGSAGAGSEGAGGFGGTAGAGGASGSPGAGGAAGSGGSAGAGGSGGSAGVGGSGGSAGAGGPGGSAGAGGSGGSAGGGSAADAGDSGSEKDSASAQESGAAASGVHAVGNQIYDGSKLIRLLGVDESGSQYACDQGTGIFDPASASAEGANTQASITAMLTWNINAVRIPLNEDCWLSHNLTTKSTPFSGTTYQNAIQAYVTLLLQNGIYPILDLHFTDIAGGASSMDVQQPMPDANGTAFWTSVAGVFKSQDKVIFDLFNEPFPDSNMDATSAWQCWENGGSTCPGVSYPVVGMQAMLTAVRNAGATNFVVLGGLEYSNDLSQWLTYEPTDPAHNLGVSWHVYSNSNYTSNHTFSADALPVLAKVPIVATEIGDGEDPPACNGQFIGTVMDFLDNPGSSIPPQSYLAWSWSTDNMPALLSAYPGTATCDGPTYKAHLLTQ